MDPFWKFYREVKPHFKREWKDVAPESLQSPKEAKSIEHLIYCILCGVCWICPVSEKNKNYLGPAALAKGYRFIADTRISTAHREKILERVKLEDGVPACEKIFACNRVCPKGVRPGIAIKLTRDILEG
jgi:succinate dehydrogenase / fumarate reductase iron-sulfur subunit